MANELVERIQSGDVRAAARLISWVEDRRPEAREAMKAVFKLSGRAFVVGVTGPPGAGKSTLVDQVARICRDREKTVGVLAIDPTSPFSGGALLGDRIRMGRHGTDEGVFIRSMASRGAYGGVGRTTSEAIHIMDALGRDIVLIETLGVGQDEVAVAALADATLVVVQPSAGDEIQMMKAGMMEVGDFYVVNKADLPGAAETAREIREMLHRSGPPPDGPRRLFEDRRVLLTVARTGEGVALLYDAVEGFRDGLRADSAALTKLRMERTRENFRMLLVEEVGSRLWAQVEQSGQLNEWIDQLLGRTKDPYSLMDEIWEMLKSPSVLEKNSPD
jgi:LAO/AO transport system kinase